MIGTVGGEESDAANSSASIAASAVLVSGRVLLAVSDDLESTNGSLTATFHDSQGGREEIDVVR